MWLIMQQEKPEDFVIATGVQHSVREFCYLAFKHAGIELEFMARLCRKELDAMTGGDEGAVWDVRRTQQTFVRDHLLVWMPRMCDDLEARAKSGLYRGLAQMTRRFLSLEREELDAG